LRKIYKANPFYSSKMKGKIFKDFKRARAGIDTVNGLEALSTEEAVKRGLIPNGEPVLFGHDASHAGNCTIPESKIPKGSVAFVPGEYFLEDESPVADLEQRQLCAAIQFYKK